MFKGEELMNKKQIVSVVFAGAAVLLSGCATDFLSSTSSTLDAATPDITLNNFVNVRIASLKKEAAVGEGERIEALAQLMGKEDKQAFSSWLQVNYDDLFNNLKEPSELISRINSTETNSKI